MEYETDDANKSWFDRVKESPRTVSAVIIILIVVAAIYAFSGNQNQPGDEVAEENATPEATEVATTSEATPAPSAKEEATQKPTPLSKESLATGADSLPKAEKTDKGYQEVAERGNGVTHLARRATARYLAENTVNYEITNEHRIYIEDYIKDHMGKKQVSVGQAEVIPFDLIAQAVESASHLSGSQLNHLTQYTHVLK